MSHTEVLVVGAGPVGLAVAIGLAQLGVAVRVVDRASASKREPRAAVVWPRAAEVLQDLRGLQGFLDRGNRLETVDVVASGRRLGRLDLGHVGAIVPWPLVIEQHDIERLLATTLASHGVGIEWNSEVIGLEIREDGISATVRDVNHGDDERVVAGYVVGCEGTRSAVRDAAGIAYVGRPRPNLQVLQINAWPRWGLSAPRTHGWFFLESDASLGVFAIPGGGYRFFCFTTDPDPARTGQPSRSEMRDLIARMTRQPELELRPTEPEWINRACFQDRIAARLRAGRVLLAGDAAHAWAPIGGHGMNAGLRGAHNLAWKLAAVVRGSASDALLDSYDLEQRRAAASVMSEMRFNVLELPLPRHIYRPVTALLPALLASTAARRNIEHRLSDLGMNHRTSPLSVDRLPGGLRRRLHLPHAGDRVPNAPAIVDGQPGTLHQWLDYSHWTAFTTDAERLPALGQAMAGFSVAVRAMNLGTTAKPGVFMLVRPDRHIGYLSLMTDLQALPTYLRSHVSRTPLP